MYSQRDPPSPIFTPYYDRSFHRYRHCWRRIHSSRTRHQSKNIVGLICVASKHFQLLFVRLMLSFGHLWFSLVLLVTYLKIEFQSKQSTTILPVSMYGTYRKRQPKLSVTLDSSGSWYTLQYVRRTHTRLTASAGGWPRARVAKIRRSRML